MVLCHFGIGNKFVNLKPNAYFHLANLKFLNLLKYFSFGLTIETTIDFGDVLPFSDHTPNVQIIEGEVLGKANQLTRICRRGIRAKFGGNSMNCILNWEGVGKFQIRDGNTIIYQNLGADEGTLKLFILSEVIGLLLFQRGLFLLHGSAIQIKSGAYVFLGIPGAGKSTTAAAFWQAGNTILSDDLVAIQIIDNQTFVIPAFPQFKIWQNSIDGLKIENTALKPSFEGAAKFLINQPISTFPQEPILLTKIFFLYPTNSRKKEGFIHPINAPTELVKHFPVPIQVLKNDLLKQHFSNSLAIAQSSALIKMKRPASFDLLKKKITEL